MIEEFDSLVISDYMLDKLTEEEIKERTKKRDELIRKMSDEEIEILYKRPYPPQYKIKIKEIREHKDNK